MDFKTYPGWFDQDPIASTIASAITELVDGDEYQDAVAERVARGVGSMDDVVYVPVPEGHRDAGVPEAGRQLHAALDMIAQRGPARPATGAGTMDSSTFMG